MDTKKISEVAKIVGVTQQTIRNYLNLGSEFFSETATRRTKKRFTDKDIEQLQQIRNFVLNDIKFSDIPNLLTPVPRIVDPTPEEEKEEPPPPPTSAMERQYQQIIAAQQLGHEREISAKNEFIEFLQTENERLRAEIKHARLPWHKRLFANNEK